MTLISRGEIWLFIAYAFLFAAWNVLPKKQGSPFTIASAACALISIVFVFFWMALR